MSHTSWLFRMLLFAASWSCWQVAGADDPRAKKLVAEGNIEYRQLDFSKALAKYDAALGADASYAVAHSNRGLALHRLGRLDESTLALHKAIALAPGQAAFQLNLSKVQAAAGQLEAAMQAAEKAIALDESLAAAAYNRLWILDESGKAGEAAAAATALEGMAKQPPGAKLLAAIVRARGGDARSLAEVCLAEDELPQLWQWLGKLNQSLATGGIEEFPPEARTALRQALTAVSAEQFGAARKHLAVAAAKSDRSPIPHWLTAMTFVVEGMSEEADRAMKLAAPLMSSVKLPASSATVAIAVDGRSAGLAPLEETLLPGAHVFAVASREGDTVGMLRVCSRLAAGETYTPPLDQLALVTIRVPADLALTGDGAMVSLEGLAPGSAEAQVQQLFAVAEEALPLEVTTRKTGIRFRLVPGGEFSMGSIDREKHWVTIGKPFYLGVCEVTQAQWQAVMGTNPSKFGGKAEHPVEQVSWQDCQTFIERLNGMEDGTFRLPTEAEWEYACRAGTKTSFYWGDDGQIDTYAWHTGNSGGETHQVGQKRPNAWGLYDMSGNVWEWCSDWYGDYTMGKQSDPKGAAGGSIRVLRGGSWSLSSAICRSAGRGGSSPSLRGSNLGFRLVRAVP